MDTIAALIKEKNQIEYNLRYTKFEGSTGEKSKQALEKRCRDVKNILKYIVK